MLRRWVLAPALAVLMIAAFNPTSGSAAPSGNDGPGLSKQDTARLAQARSAKKSTVTVLLASRSGQQATVAAGLAKVGAKIRYRDDDLGYVRADVPTGAVATVSKLSGVQTVQIDGLVPLPDPKPEASQNPTPQPAPDQNTPAVNPYLPVGDTGAAQFVDAHPTFDGRGVTIGELDTGVDLDHPALKTTTTGERKIVEWVTATDPVNDGDPTWISMSTKVGGPQFTVAGVTYVAPSGGTFRFGMFDERALGATSEYAAGTRGADVNRDGNPDGSTGLFGVLWDTQDRVWVDTNQNGSFLDEQAMTDYKDGYDIGHFGVDNPATALAETVPFVVQIDAADKFVNIGIVSGEHGTHVAGIQTGNGLFGGAMRGAAPGAKLVSVRVCLFVAGCTDHAMTEGMIYAVKVAQVDVVNMSIGGLPSLNDGNNTRAELYNRLIQQYGAQMFFSAGNSGPGVNTVGDPSVATDVMSVGSYITNETWAADYGSSAPYEDNMHGYSSRGPREDGGFKPDIMAPGAAVASTPLWLPGGPVGGTYELPPGYSMLNGTSMASPQATGAAALLISAAKKQGFAHSPKQLRQAIRSSARFISNYQAYEQGAGLFNVEGAYQILAREPKTVDISTAVPVNTLLSGFLATPGVGVGIHDREGVKQGEAYTRTYTLTRTTGPTRPISYLVSWQGNDGTFSSAGNVSLPKDTPVSFDVRVTPDAVGIHSAIMRLDDVASPGFELETMNTVMVPYEFTSAANYQVSIDGSVGRNQSLHYFFRVPAGTPAMKVDFTGPSTTPGTGQARFLRWHPYGMAIDSNASANCFSPPASTGCTTGSPNSRTAQSPTAGVWEVTVEGRRTSDLAFTPFTLTASVLGASVAPNPDVIDTAAVGSTVGRSYTLTNKFGPFTGRAAGSTLGSARQGPFTITAGAKQYYDVTVMPGSTSLRATIGNTSDLKADLDLYISDCTSGTCVDVASSADGDSEESATVANPKAGHYQVRIEGYAVPSGSTSYDYVDVFANAAFGSVSVTDANALRDIGATWTVPGTVTVNAAPEVGRVLLGQVQVRTDVNALIGSADVVVKNVS